MHRDKFPVDSSPRENPHQQISIHKFLLGTFVTNMMSREEYNKTQESFKKLLEPFTNKRNQALEHLPKVLAVKKAKFLSAIGKPEENSEEIKFEDEKLPIDGLKFSCLSLETRKKGVDFYDSLIEMKFKKIQKPVFNLAKYVGCAKIVYLNYIGVNNFDKYDNSAFSYVLAFAKDFADPKKDMFKFSKNGTEPLSPIDCTEDIVASKLPGNSEYIKNINELFTELLRSYSEEKYQNLNLNITYLILLMARRIVKSDKEFANALINDKTHANYAELCPCKLDNRLPMITEENNKVLADKLRGRNDNVILLVLYAYMKPSSDHTRRVLRATCIPYMENNGLGLPTLFFKVVELYNVEEGKLWDMLSIEDNCEALISLSDYRYSQFEGAKCDPPKTYDMFPYCRVLSSSFHCDLSASKNYIMCYALACLIDFKSDSNVKCSAWTKTEFLVRKKTGMELAKTIYKLIN